jgi:hypothetical protein
MAMIWIILNLGTTAMRTQCFLLMTPVASVWSALLRSKVERRISKVGSAMGGGVGVGDVDGEIGANVVCVPALRRCRWPLEVAKVGT